MCFTGFGVRIAFVTPPPSHENPMQMQISQVPTTDHAISKADTP